MEQQDILGIVAKILEKLNIPYFVTGGFAVSVWGRPRYTADIDLVIAIERQKLERLAAELLKIDKYVYISKQAMYEALEKQGEFNFIDSTNGIKVDFWVLKNTIFAKKQMERRISKDINGQKIYFASAEDVILNKLIWYKDSRSDKQMEDIESILTIQTNLDHGYLESRAKEQNIYEFLQPLLKK